MTSESWLYKGKEFSLEEFPKTKSFVYLIIHKPTGNWYIGKKFVTSFRKQKKTGRRKQIESNWKGYFSSSETLKEMVLNEGPENFERHILSVHNSRAEANYYEVWWQFKLDVLMREDCINDTIGGKWMKKNVNRYPREQFDFDLLERIPNS